MVGHFRQDVVNGEGAFYQNTGKIIRGVWEDN